MKRSPLSLLIALICVLSVLQSCAYFQNRVGDLGDIADVGFSFSKDPYIAAYYDFVPIIPIGYGHVEGTYLGLGGGKMRGFDPHFERSMGLILWGQEELTFDKSMEELGKMTDEQRMKALDSQRTGLIGMFQGPFPGPNYLISCPHYIHIGWIGVVVTPRYLQMLDFLIGFSTIDICWDDDAGKPISEIQPAKNPEEVNKEQGTKATSKSNLQKNNPQKSK